jgi:hypothetical protein
MARLELLASPERFEGVASFLGKQVRTGVPITVSAETVEVFRSDHY